MWHNTNQPKRPNQTKRTIIPPIWRLSSPLICLSSKLPALLYEAWPLITTAEGAGYCRGPLVGGQEVRSCQALFYILEPSGTISINKWPWIFHALVHTVAVNYVTVYLNVFGPLHVSVWWLLFMNELSVSTSRSIKSERGDRQTHTHTHTHTVFKV